MRLLPWLAKRPPATGYRVLARFHDPREEAVPDWAENHNRSTFEKRIKKPSQIIPGASVTECVFHCPSCMIPIPLEHGDRVLCGLNTGGNIP